MSFWTKCFLVAVSAWITMFLLSSDDPDIYPDLVRDKNIIITGGSSGIGEQAAYYAATLGASVVVAARRRELLNRVVAKCKELSPNPQAKFGYVVADFSQPDVGETVVMQAVTFLGGIDFLILNHAFLMTDDDEHQAWNGSAAQRQQMTYSMDVNFYSFIQMTDHAMPYLKQSNGSITVVSSMIVEHSAFSLPYGVTKSALNSFYTGLRQELIIKKENVSVTVIHLGLIHTESGLEALRSVKRTTSRDHFKLMSVFPATHPPEGGAELIQATARRDAYVYFPRNQMLWLIRIMRILQKDPDVSGLQSEELVIRVADWKAALLKYFYE